MDTDSPMTLSQQQRMQEATDHFFAEQSFADNEEEHLLNSLLSTRTSSDTNIRQQNDKVPHSEPMEVDNLFNVSSIASDGDFLRPGPVDQRESTSKNVSTTKSIDLSFNVSSNAITSTPMSKRAKIRLPKGSRKGRHINVLMPIEKGSTSVDAETPNDENTFPTNDEPMDFFDDDGNRLNVQNGSVEHIVLFAKKFKNNKETRGKYKMQYRIFLRYVDSYKGRETRIALETGALPNKEVILIMANYFRTRINLTVFKKTGKKVPLDTSTQEKMWYSLLWSLRELAGYDVREFPDIDLLRGAKNAASKSAAENHGLGQAAHQSIPWSKGMLVYVLSNDHLNVYTSRGLSTLWYFLCEVNFAPRVRKEMRLLTRADFRRVYSEACECFGLAYDPQGTTKRDQGDAPARRNAGHKKRPVAIRCKTDSKLDVVKVFSALEAQLDLLPLLEDEPDRGHQKLFKKLRQDHQKPGEPMFYKENMGLNTFDSIVRVAAWSCGLNPDPLLCHNQCLRTTFFCLHEDMGIAPGITAAMAGHSSEKTQRLYKRYYSKASAHTSATFLTHITGQEHRAPADDHVKLIDGTIVKVDVDAFVKGQSIGIKNYVVDDEYFVVASA